MQKCILNYIGGNIVFDHCCYQYQQKVKSHFCIKFSFCNDYILNVFKSITILLEPDWLEQSPIQVFKVFSDKSLGTCIVKHLYGRILIEWVKWLHLEHKDSNTSFLKVKIYWQCNEKSFSSQITEGEDRRFLTVRKSPK